MFGPLGTRILHSSSKAQDNEDSRNHGLQRILVFMRSFELLCLLLNTAWIWAALKKESLNLCPKQAPRVQDNFLFQNHLGRQETSSNRWSVSSAPSRISRTWKVCLHKQTEFKHHGNAKPTARLRYSPAWKSQLTSHTSQIFGEVQQNMICVYIYIY